jgi:hypothetical protein
MKAATRFVLTTALAVSLATAAAHAQVFSILPAPPVEPGAKSSIEGPRPTRGVVLRIDTAALARSLEGAPAQRFDATLRTYGLAIKLPHPRGGLVDCFVASSPVMQPALAAKFPQIRTYLVQSADGEASGRLELSPRGLTAMLRATDGVWMIDPWRSADPDHAVAYWLRDLPDGGDWTCSTTEGVHGFGASESNPGLPTTRGPGTQPLRTYRLAMACTGEFGFFHSQREGHEPNIADPLAVIVTMVARTNVVYEADLAVHFDLVASNDLIIFTDPTTDPYASTCGGSGGTDCSGSHLSVNIATLNTIIGAANYDVGHVVTRIFGGVAYLSAICTNNKAGGVSGIPRGGDIDPLSALVVIHEMGHQFGANHTFSGTRGRCFGNVSLPNAWEAGSGSSPMAYAGGCPVGDAAPSDNIVQFADPFFHHASAEAMLGLIAATSCAQQTQTSNNAPVLNPIANALIPPATPFILSATASDADQDSLTYSWEQRDSGVARPLSGTGAEDNGSGALFRIFPPVLSSTRTFPQIGDVLSNVPTPGERLPTITGTTRQFRVIVRDNHPGAGGVAISPAVTLTIPSGATPFAVTSPGESSIIPTGRRVVAWSVGGTNLPPISCSSVSIRLSTDGGATFPTFLGSFPNTGTATVQLPSAAPQARIRIEANGRIFFAMSRAFEIDPACAADLDNTSASGTPDGAVDINDLLYFLVVFEAGSTSADLDDGSGSGMPNGAVDINDFLFFLVHFEAGC